MNSFLKRVLMCFPPLERRARELATLRAKNSSLQGQLEASESRLQTLQRDYERAQSELNALWVPPGHFYSPIPAVCDLKSNETEIFDIPPAVRGVALNDERQFELLTTFAAWYGEQPFPETRVSDRRYFFENPNNSYTDAIILYCMMRYLKPRRIVEVGSGYSSCAMLDINQVFFNNQMS